LIVERCRVDGFGLLPGVAYWQPQPPPAVASLPQQADFSVL